MLSIISMINYIPLVVYITSNSMKKIYFILTFLIMKYNMYVVIYIYIYIKMVCYVNLQINIHKHIGRNIQIYNHFKILKNVDNVLIYFQSLNM